MLIPSKDGVQIDGMWRGYHEALTRCYERYAEGEVSIVRLMRRLNSAGYRFRDRDGKPRLFDEWDVRRILDANRIYAGYVIMGRAKDRPDELIKGSHKPILPVSLCDRVAEVLRERNEYAANFKGRHGTKKVYLLSDVLYCGACGHRMAGLFQDGTQWYRHERSKCDCPSKGQVKAEMLEAQIMERMHEFEVPEQMKERIRFLVERMIEQAGQPDWQEARATVKHLARKLENLKDLRIEGEIDRTEYQKRKQEIEA